MHRRKLENNFYAKLAWLSFCFQKLVICQKLQINHKSYIAWTDYPVNRIPLFPPAKGTTKSKPEFTVMKSE